MVQNYQQHCIIVAAKLSTLRLGLACAVRPRILTTPWKPCATPPGGQIRVGIGAIPEPNSLLGAQHPCL